MFSFIPLPSNSWYGIFLLLNESHRLHSYVNHCIYFRKTHSKRTTSRWFAIDFILPSISM
ncbi:hypothetical protein BGW80DRAFT_1392770 [Lactifluus volemus]|nr:hypothetical protein BGW80DRAFT_1392770 [Lactifluus volemus]